ncbi:asparaginase [Azonexus hydrophilus]|uniref:Asparaginase n=1 Tax=Azonexus hydrophilus TaxID=418702 RepID=A0ABZ2XGX8_9RHOO|nr:asparaginase [Dechloromonas sp.]
MKTLILHTGGTIGMVAAADGYRPTPGFPARLRAALAARDGKRLPDVDIVELPPIDSADLRPGHWPTIARALLDRWDDYTGFVILHGTDTMAWSASALSFMLRGTDKPVILTGAQIPLGEAGSDALANVDGALHFTAVDPVPEVAIHFGGRLLRGNRSRKLAATEFAAFDSPNDLPLAEAGGPAQRDRILSPGEKCFVVPEFDDQAVAVLTLHPGIAARTVDAVTANPRVRGLILQTYGVGNAPQGDRELMAALERAAARGIVLVNTSQCLIGGVSQETYATGAALARIGVVAAGDMTLEAAFAKLHCLLASENDAAKVRQGLSQCWCGEKS